MFKHSYYLARGQACVHLDHLNNYLLAYKMIKMFKSQAFVNTEHFEKVTKN